MEACHENSKQLITMQNQMTNMQVTMQAIADQMSVLTEHIKDNPNRSPVKKKQRQTDNQLSHTELDGTKLNFNQHSNIPDNLTQHNQSTADQEEAQYNDTSYPDTAMDE
jgi:hypothetical protein